MNPLPETDLRPSVGGPSASAGVQNWKERLANKSNSRETYLELVAWARANPLDALEEFHDYFIWLSNPFGERGLMSSIGMGLVESGLSPQEVMEAIDARVLYRTREAARLHYVRAMIRQGDTRLIREVLAIDGGVPAPLVKESAQHLLTEEGRETTLRFADSLPKSETRDQLALWAVSISAPGMPPSEVAGDLTVLRDVSLRNRLALGVFSRHAASLTEVLSVSEVLGRDLDTGGREGLLSVGVDFVLDRARRRGPEELARVADDSLKIRNKVVIETVSRYLKEHGLR